MAKEFVRKVRNISDVESLSINETIPADLVLDTDYKLWYHGKNRHVKLANDEEVVHNFGDEEIKGLKTFDDLLTAKDGITDEGDLVVLGETKLSKGLTVGGDESIAGNLTVIGGTVTDGLEVKGDATFEKGVVVNGDEEIKGNETIEKDLTVLGHATLSDFSVADDIDWTDLTFEAGVSGTGKYCVKLGEVKVLLDSIILPKVEANSPLILAKIPAEITPTIGVREVVLMSNGGVANVGMSKEGNIIITDGVEIPASTTFSFYKEYDRTV